MSNATIFSVIPIMIPDNNDDYIKVGFPVHICESDDCGHLIRVDTEIEKAIEKQKVLYGWKGRTSYKQGMTILAGFSQKDEQAARAKDEKIVNKLRQMTRWDYYNKSI